jgi:DNA helicase II / ATP-dependent DNA helicase PcrA
MLGRVATETTPGARVDPGASQTERLLADLNPPQREAVTHGEGPLLVLAGAGSGKTRVLTYRIAYLLATGQALPSEILAITFTNKAAGEMRERVERLVGGVSRVMWVMTFHSACARILRTDAQRLGYKRAFTIYDEADSLRMIKRCVEEAGVDPKRFPPRAIRAAISGAKSQLTDAEAYAEVQGSYFEENVADVYRLYEKRMLEANAMDFDDLLVRTVNLLELFEDVRERYRKAFRWVLVDEYQDTNRAQYRLLQLIAGEHRNLTVVGDEDQCLIEGTRIALGDGSEKPIEELQEGDEVLSCYGSAAFRGARVTGVFKAWEQEGIVIRTRGGRELTSTPEHMHFAGYQLGITPQMHITYLMWKQEVGFRVGTSRVYTEGQRKPIVGFRQRCLHEHADAVWVISTHETEVEARAAETLLSLKYRLPTIPLLARNSPPEKSLVGNQDMIDRIFSTIDTESGGRRLLEDEGLSIQHPHHQPQASVGKRRILNLTLCAEKRGAVPMHRVALAGDASDSARASLERIGLKTRPAKAGSKAWRYETVLKDFGEAVRVAGDVNLAVDAIVRIQGRFGPKQSGRMSGNSLPCIPAASVRPGMAMFAGDGSYDVVEAVDRVTLDRPVYDINVEGTHNFIANGVVTHNSVYAFRHADIRNILDFERDFPDATVVRLEENYRSTGTILDAANAVIASNTERLGKHLWTGIGRGEPVTIAEHDDEHSEARYVASEIERLATDEGLSRDEIAVFYRVNAQSRVLEDTMVRFEIPYQVIGGTKFYERAEIKDAVAYLSLLANPSDYVSFARIVNSPRRGIGDTTQARLLSHANTTGQDIWDVMREAERVPALGPAAQKAVRRFADTMVALRHRADAAHGSAPVAELLQAVLDETGYLEALRAERTIEAEGRIENLEELVGVAGEFDANRAVEGFSDVGPLEEFLAQISLYTDQDSMKTDESLCTLMTLHNAKGLEYDAVFMIGCEEGVFPHMRSIEEGNLEEERRLCYVGVTRARQRLYLTYARRRSLHGGRGYNLPSRFLAEIPKALVERETTSSPTGWARGLGGGLTGPEPPQPHAVPLAFEVGADVVHATFGEGVVTGVEPGGVIVVRFAGDATERKLMADYAPLRKAG